jgi:hypothetical protein
MKFEDSNGSLIALVVKESSAWVQDKLARFKDTLAFLMEDRFFQEDSRRDGYTFDSLRFDLYNRFAEKVISV